MSDLDSGIEAAYERMRRGSAEFVAGLSDWQRCVAEKMTILHARSVNAARRDDVALRTELAALIERVAALEAAMHALLLRVAQLLTMEEPTHDPPGERAA
jgi:hypothetical protein